MVTGIFVQTNSPETTELNWHTGRPRGTRIPCAGGRSPNQLDLHFESRQNARVTGSLQKTTLLREMRRLNRQPQMRTNRCLAHWLTALSTMALSLLPNSVSYALLTANGATSGPVIRLEDVGLFYAVYDDAGRHPSADQLQHDYLDRGSEGLHTFARIRNITGANVAAALSKNPELYSEARHCAAALPRARERVYAAI